MKYATSIAVIGDPEGLAQSIKDIAHIGGTIKNIALDTNGNYDAVIEHADRKVLLKFVMEHNQEEHPSSWLEEQIYEVIDDADLDLSKWSPETAWMWIMILKGVVEAGDPHFVVQNGKLLVIYPQSNDDKKEIDGPGLLAFDDGDKIRCFSRKGFGPNL